MYTTIKAYCVDQTLQVSSIPKLASGGENEIRIEVSFDTHWDGLGKTAIFYREENKVYHVLMVNGVCVIPREVLTTSGKLYFGIIGTAGSSVRTSEVIALNVAQGAITGLGDFKPLPDVYKQVLEAYASAEASIAAEASARKQEIAVERARLDNIIANSGTSDDAELVDIRVGADGKTYTTAGEAVRGQVDYIRKQAHYGARVDTPQQIIIYDLVEGSYYSSQNGTILNAADYKRSGTLIPCAAGVFVGCQQKVNDDTMMIVCYDENFMFLDYRMVLDPVAPSPHTRLAMTPAHTAYIGFNVLAANPESKFTLDIIDGSAVKDIAYPFPGNHKDYLAFEGYWVNGVGALTTADSMNCVLVPNINADRLFVDVQYVYNAIFFDEDNSVISNGAAYTTAAVKGALYDVPAEAKMVAINLSRTQTDMDGNPSSFAAFVRESDDTLSGKSVLAIGDSITWLDNRNGAYDGGTSIHGWQSELRKMGATVDTVAYSGACYANNNDATSLYQYIVDQNADVTGYDIVILFGGANDVRLSIPLGDASSAYASPNTDPSTFNGAIGGLIEYIRTKNPTAEVYLCTTLPSESDARLYAHNKAYRDAILQNGEFWCVPCIDMFTKMNATPGLNFSEYFYDNTHPNAHGMKRIGRIIGKYIDSM